MRIIITDKGNTLQKALMVDSKEQKVKEDELKHDLIHQLLNPISRNNSSNKSLNIDSSKINKNNKLRFRSFDLSLNKNPIASSNVRYINVKEKVFIPKNISEKYNIDTTSKLVLPQFPEALVHKQEKIYKDLENSFEKKSIHDLKSIQGIYNRNQLPIREIINKVSYDKLIEGIEKEELIKKKIVHVSQIPFRTPYRERSKTKEIEENLNKMIDCTNIDLIKYLNSKSDIPEHLLTNINRFDEERLKKSNKLCQKVLTNIHNYEQFEKQIKEQLVVKKEIQEKEAVNSMFISCLNKQKSCQDILRDYKKERPRFDAFIVEFHNHIKNSYWEKYNAQHLERRTKKEKPKETVSSVTKNERY